MKEFLVAQPVATTTISVTGASCALKCAHCGGHYLSKMLPLSTITDPTSLNCASCLISGGCDATGRVNMLPHLAKLKELKAGRKYNFHVGLISEAEAQLIAPLADAVSFDFIGAESTIRNTLHLTKSVEDYVRCYEILKRTCQHVVPHICIGLEGGRIVGEYRALELLKKLGSPTIVFLVLIPTKETEYAEVFPPQLAAVTEFLRYARTLLPASQLILGCMRPGGNYRAQLDVAAVELGLDGIVNPVRAAVTLAQAKGYKLRFSKECCIL